MQVDTTKRADEEAWDGLILLLFVSFSQLSTSPTAAFPGEELPTYTHGHTRTFNLDPGAICIECLPSEAAFLLCAAGSLGFSAEQQVVDDSSTPCYSSTLA